jgi:hypothetical protein
MTTTENISCGCPVHKGTETITVPASLLVNPKPGARTTDRYRQTVIHNLVDMNRLFPQYPTA